MGWMELAGDAAAAPNVGKPGLATKTGYACPDKPALARTAGTTARSYGPATPVMRPLPAMKLHQIRYLIAVAGQGSIRAASRALGVTQAAVTQALRELEADQQLPLFQRQSAGLVLTDAGAALLRHARLIADQLDQAQAEMARLRQADERGRLSVGVTPWIAQSFLRHVVHAFTQAFPQVRLELFDGLSALALPRLRDGALDLLLGRLPAGGDGHDLQATPLFGYDATVGARVGHPLSQARQMGELADAAWLLNYAPQEEAVVFNDLFQQHGLAVPRERIHLAQSAALMLELVANTDMLTLLPWPLIECAGAHGRLVPLNLQSRFAPRQVGLLRRRHSAMSLPEEGFVALLLTQIRQGQHTADAMLQRVFRSVDILV